MLVTQVEDHLCWRQIQDVGDRFFLFYDSTVIYNP